MRALLVLGWATLLNAGVPAVAPDVIARARTPSLGERVLDLALVDDERLVALSPEAVALYRWARDGLVLESRRLLPGPIAAVRAPGGLLTPPDEGGAFWALTSGSPGATLYRIEGRGLVEVSRAGALPWPGSPEGLRFRPGTNLIEGRIASLGDGPFLTLEAGFAVDADGRLRGASLAPLESVADDGAVADAAPGLALPSPAAVAKPLRVGPTLAALGRLLAASTAEAPGPTDAVWLLSPTLAGWRIARSIPVDGAVRALGSRARRGGWRLVAAVEDLGADSWFVVLDLAPVPR